MRHHLPTFAQVDLCELDLKDPIGILWQNSKEGFYKVVQWQRGGRNQTEQSACVQAPSQCLTPICSSIDLQSSFEKRIDFVVLKSSADV